MSEGFHNAMVAKMTEAHAESNAAVIIDVLKEIERAAAQGKNFVFYARPLWCPPAVLLYQVIRNGLHRRFSVVYWSGDKVRIGWGPTVKK